MAIYIFHFLLIGLFMIPGNLTQKLPQWASSYGTETSYSKQTHLTGFGMKTVEDSREQALEDAKTQAASDLIRKVRVSVKSSISSEIRETESSVSSNFNAVNQTITNLHLQGIDFEVADDKNTFYALAFIRRSSATEFYSNAAKETLIRIQSLQQQAQSLEASEKNSEALEKYVLMSPLFKNYYEQYALANTLKSTSAKAFDELHTELEKGNISLINPLKVVTMEQQAQQKITALLNEASSSMEDATRILVKQLGMQGLKAGKNKVLDLKYRGSDFSSAFGSYAAQALQTEMATGLPRGSESIITQGYYWDLGDEIELSVTVINEKGGKLAGAKVLIPQKAIPKNLKIKPRNFEQALKEKNALTDETLVDGGISVEIMSDRGGNDESVVLDSGEEVNFYFRVNQPAFLQLTYVLANGMKVMLWDSYYIGIDRVNKIVNFPYTFEVTPPLGVERLVVTAHSKEPPKPTIQIQTIEGEDYEVITEELSEMLAKTRGLKLKSKNKARVGTANLVITTLPGKN